MSVIHVNGEAYEEIHRTRVAAAWCFGCRKRLPHDRVVMMPSDSLSYYGAHVRWECCGCGQDRRRFGS